jgi:hypothetical protein
MSNINELKVSMIPGFITMPSLYDILTISQFHRIKGNKTVEKMITSKTLQWQDSDGTGMVFLE